MKPSHRHQPLHLEEEDLIELVVEKRETPLTFLCSMSRAPSHHTTDTDGDSARCFDSVNGHRLGSTGNAPRGEAGG